MSTTTNVNYLQNNGFSFGVKRLPNVSFFVKSVATPAITAAPAVTANPFNSIPWPGDHMSFGELTVEFFVDEDMTAYREVFYWMTGLYFPQKWEQYAELAQISKTPGSSSGLVSDLSLSVLNSVKKPINTIQYRNAFPTALSGMNLTYANTDVDAPTCSVTFTYQDFDFTS